MDARLLAALVSTIICQVAILLILALNHSHYASSSAFNSVWSILVQNLHSSQAVAAVLIEEEEGKRKKRRRVMAKEEEEDDRNVDHDFTGLVRIESGWMESASFKANFRMSPTTFEWLCKQFEPFVTKTNNVGVFERVGMGLFRLATGSSYQAVSQRFVSTEPTARLCTKELCRVLCINFKFWVAYPSPWDLPKVSNEFQTLSGLPNCCGAVDCTRFKFTNTDYPYLYNEEDDDLQQSVVTQIVVDCSSKILSIITGFKGNKGDSRVLRSSTLYADIEEGRLLNSPPLHLKGISVPQYLVGDSGYPLLPWLMVPYTDPVVTSCQEDFNSKHYLMRQAALRTLSCLRKWGILNKPIEEDVRVAVACIGACAILHNILLAREGGSTMLEGTEDYALHDQSSQYYRDANMVEYYIEKKASVIRNALAGKARDMRNSEQTMSSQ